MAHAGTARFAVACAASVATHVVVAMAMLVAAPGDNSIKLPGAPVYATLVLDSEVAGSDASVSSQESISEAVEPDHIAQSHTVEAESFLPESQISDVEELIRNYPAQESELAMIDDREMRRSFAAAVEHDAAVDEVTEAEVTDRPPELPVLEVEVIVSPEPRDSDLEMVGDDPLAQESAVALVDDFEVRQAFAENADFQIEAAEYGKPDGSIPRQVASLAQAEPQASEPLNELQSAKADAGAKRAKRSNRDEIAAQRPSSRKNAEGMRLAANQPPRQRSAGSASTAERVQFSDPVFGVAGLSNPAPRYPRQARANNEQGRVVLLVHVGPDGRPTKVDVQQSSGFKRLDRSAVKAVKQWIFLPATVAGVPTHGVVRVPVSFVLTG